ncbi:P-loop containing nucleoside triphosphate hydrolase protein [Peziza echinospora]|nr:P-loop containing nucleoside triphosphate hydrolase protein [Peziza echinospora]
MTTIGGNSTADSNNSHSTDNHVDNTVNNSRNNTNTTINYYNSHTGGNALEVVNTPHASNTPPPPKLFMVSYAEPTNFIGKSQTMAWLEKDLVGKDGWNTSHRRMALWGIGGAGKSQDVIQCLHKYMGTANIFWIDAGCKTKFTNGYADIAKAVGIDSTQDYKDIRLQVRMWFESEASGDWILVLDNADNKRDFISDDNTTDSERKELLKQFIPQGTKGRIIVTTRDLEVGYNLTNGIGEVVQKASSMEQSNAIALFNSRCAQYKDDPSIPELLRELQSLPLAVVQAAAYLNYGSHLSPLQYLERFTSVRARQRHILTHKISETQRRDENETVLTTFAITFDHVCEQSKLAGFLLTVIACLDNRKIPGSLLEKCAEASGLAAAHETPYTAIKKLENFALITKHSTRGQETLFDVHSLIHFAIGICMKNHEGSKQRLKAFKLERTIEILVSALADPERFPDGKFENWDNCSMHLPHVCELRAGLDEAALHIKHSSKTKSELAHIYHVLSEYLFETKRYPDAWMFGNDAVKLRESVLTYKDARTLSSAHILANICYRQRRMEEVKVAKLAEAADLLEKVVAARGKTYGGLNVFKVGCMRDFDYAPSMTLLASVYRAQGRNDEAERYIKKALDIQKNDAKTKGTLDIVVTTGLLKACSNGTKSSSTSEVQTMALNLLSQMQSNSSKSSKLFGGRVGMKFLICLAKSGFEVGTQKKAMEDLGNQYLASHTSKYGASHSSTLDSMLKVGMLHTFLGNSAKGKSLGKKAMEGFQNLNLEAKSHWLTNAERSYGKIEGSSKTPKPTVVQVLPAPKKNGILHRLRW